MRAGHVSIELRQRSGLSPRFHVHCRCLRPRLLHQSYLPHFGTEGSPERECYSPRGLMSYTVLARKYRPQTFADLVGQEHVTRALSNAIASNRVAHAFLFTGVRCVGKTTSARILAKALNCEKGPTATPCLVCSPCKEIAAGSDVDVQEIDGASYNGVDEVRTLQTGLP